MTILNLGCGKKKFKDAINVDMVKEVDPDIVLNLDRYPWPFTYRHYEKVIAEDIYEHVADPIKFMAAIWKVLAPGGTVEIRTTNWQTENSYTDPTHKRFCTLQSFDYWDPRTEIGSKYGFYDPKTKFEIVKKESSGQELVFILKKLEV